MLYSMHYPSPLGTLMLASDDDKFVGLWIEGQKYFAAHMTGNMPDNPELPVFTAVRHWLDRYFDGKRPPITDLPLAPKGSAFRQAVWKILCKIPYGELITYGEIAKNIAALTNRTTLSSQAVGGAVAHNPISIVIPCHRVVGSSGSLTGYAGGIDKKIWLLEHEGIDISRLFVPVSGTAL